MIHRAEETDLRVLAAVEGFARVCRGNDLSPFEQQVAVKLIVERLLRDSRCPQAMMHQIKGMLAELSTSAKSLKEEVVDAG